MRDGQRILALPVTIESLHIVLQVHHDSHSLTSIPDLNRPWDETIEFRSTGTIPFVFQLLFFTSEVFIRLGIAFFPAIDAAITVKGTLNTERFLLSSLDCFISGIKVKSPPVEVDSRWDTENIVNGTAVTIRFPLVKALLLYMISLSEVRAVTDRIPQHALIN